MSQPELTRRPDPPDDFVPFAKAEIEQSLASRFEQTARRHPDRLAVKDRSLQLTYAQLEEAANRVAHAILARYGAGPEPVALLFEHGGAFVPALLGVTKTGKFYVPLDPALPGARLAEMLADLGTRLILTNTASAANARGLASGAAQVIDVDSLDARAPAAPPGVAVTPADIAYVIYTSGSTGRPKGVMVDHRAALHYAMTYTNSARYGRGDRISALNAFSTHAAATDIFPAILNGAAVFPFSLRAEGVEALADWLEAEGITSYGSVPLVFRRLAAGLTGAGLFPRLRLIRLGGDRLLRSDVDLFKAHFSPRCLLRNGLGAAEVLLIRECFIGARTKLTTSVMPVGHALEDTEVLILDGAQRPLGPGQVGQIAVKGRYLSPGYWRRPDLTAERFLDAPDGERVYLTGDLGRLNPDGCLFHLGRKDFLVKIRGKLIAPVEVENTLLDVPGIKEAVVVAREDEAGEPRLVAYLVPVEAPGPSVSAIRRALAERLSREMMPAAFVALDALPLTGNSKVDRAALPAVPASRPALETPFVPPRTAIETLLAALWAEVLKTGEPGVQDDFFELGGDSLQAAQLGARVIARLGVDIPLGTLLQAATVEAMAAMVRAGLAGRAGTGGAGEAP